MQAGLSFAMLEAGLRGAVVALLVLLAALLLRDARRAPAGLYGALFDVSVAAYVFVTAPDVLHQPMRWLLPFRLVSLGTPVTFWLFASASFDDTFVPSWRHALPWLGTVALGYVCASGLLPAAYPLYHAVQVVFVGLAIRQAVIGRAADLVEERRQLRVALVLSAAIYTMVVIGLETFKPGALAVPPLSTVNAAGVLALTFSFLLVQLSLSARGQLIPVAPVPQRSFPVHASPPPETPPIDDQEMALLDRLRRLMEQERIYREEGLSVAALADKLAIPEYRLRRLINGRLGHRNFSTFVNAYRLMDAVAALGDPGQANVPVVTIALDAGFQSLGPFNRAFKAHTGMTPTDYRRVQLGRTERPA
jgi:AraC-like DNA-binding protein